MLEARYDGQGQGFLQESCKYLAARILEDGNIPIGEFVVASRKYVLSGDIFHSTENHLHSGALQADHFFVSGSPSNITRGAEGQTAVDPLRKRILK